MALENKIKKEKTKRGEVTVVIAPLTQKEAREMFPYRPFSQSAESRFGGNELYDDVCLLLNERARRCPMCQAATKTEYLDPNCPDCDGRSEFNGTNPRAKEVPYSGDVVSSGYAEDGEAD